MAIAIDPSSPPITAIGDSARTTAAFSPPDETILVALAATQYSFGGYTISNSGSALSWTKVVDRFANGNPAGGVTIWVAKNATARTNLTVTTTSEGGSVGQVLKVFVVTGADMDNWIGNTGSGGATTSSLTVNSAYTSSAAGSRGFFIGNDWNAAGAPTVGLGDTGYTYHSTETLSGAVVHKATNTAAAGTVVGFSLTASGTREWNWGAVEILPGPDHPRLNVSRPVGAVHRAASW